MGAFIFKYKYLIAFCVFIINLVFKTYALGVNGFWADECFSVYYAEDSIEGIIKFCLEEDPNPPLYLITLHYWMSLFGDSEFDVRLLSVIASCIAASVLFLLSIRFFNWQTAVFASIMFFTSNEIYYYAQEARTYSLVILFVIISNYIYLNIIRNPKIWQPLFLGLTNAVLFYLHYLSAFNLIAQMLSLPFILIYFHKKNMAENGRNYSFRESKKRITFFLLSIIVYTGFLWSWKERFINLMLNGGKTFWLSKPTYKEFEECIYDFFNSKELCMIYITSFVALVLLFFLFKKLREKDSQKTMLFFSIMIGPLLIYLMYLVAGFSPIFLKRYVLFTLIGFMLTYSYMLSLLKINFYLKLIPFLILSVFTFKKITFPRESLYEYDKAIVFLKKIQKPDTFIWNDLQDLFTYYYDKNIFYLRPYLVQRGSLIEKNIYTPYGIELDWVDKINFSKYRDIYFTYTFIKMADTENKIEKALDQKFIFIEQINDFKGIVIKHYLNPKHRCVFLQAPNNKYMSTEAGGMEIANKEKPGISEQYTLFDLENNDYAFLSHENLFLCADLNNQSKLIAVAKTASTWEKYTLINLGSGYVAFKAFNGKYVSLDEKSQQLYARGEFIGKNEKFKLIPAN